MSLVILRHGKGNIEGPVLLKCRRKFGARQHRWREKSRIQHFQSGFLVSNQWLLK